MARVSIHIGDVIGSRYCIEAVLGQGGMAIVYQARNTGTGKACALKIVHPHLVSRPELVEMFVREAQVAGRIGESPYVVNVFDAGVDERLGVPFMAMELLKGETLDQYVESRGPMPRSMVRTLFDQLADALDQAHRSGVIHRDLKPSNLFITYDRRGRPILKIMDFGIAKVLEQGVQRTATRIGSPAYAAPEQQASAAFRRLAAKHGVVIAQSVSAATDVWAMGLVAYELLTGLPKGQYWATLESLDDIMIKVAMEDNEIATDRAGDRAYLLPKGFNDWFARCLRKNAAERWQTPGEASAALRRLLAPSDIEIESTQPMSDDSLDVGEEPAPDAKARQKRQSVPAARAPLMVLTGASPLALSDPEGARALSVGLSARGGAAGEGAAGARGGAEGARVSRVTPGAPGGAHGTKVSTIGSSVADRASSAGVADRDSRAGVADRDSRAGVRGGGEAEGATVPGSEEDAGSLGDGGEPDSGGPGSVTEPEAAFNMPPSAFTPMIHHTRPSAVPSRVPSTPRPEAGVLQTRGTWTRTNAWPRRSKVALVIGGTTFAAVALVFLFQTQLSSSSGAPGAAPVDAMSDAAPSTSVSAPSSVTSTVALAPDATALPAPPSVAPPPVLVATDAADADGADGAASPEVTAAVTASASAGKKKKPRKLSGPAAAATSIRRAADALARSKVDGGAPDASVVSEDPLPGNPTQPPFDAPGQ